jgi:hypothetical protein
LKNVSITIVVVLAGWAGGHWVAAVICLGDNFFPVTRVLLLGSWLIARLT